MAKSHTHKRAIGRTLLGAAALLGLALAWLVWRPLPATVEVTTAQRRALVVRVEELGKTRVRDRYLVSAPLAGNLVRIKLKAGDPIESGHLLAKILPATSPMLDARTRAEARARAAATGAARRAAEAMAKQAELAARHAADDLVRVRSLTGSGAMPPKALEDAEMEAKVRAEALRSARFGALTAAHEQEMAQSALTRRAGAAGARDADEFALTSPIAGAVLRVLQPSAGIVPPGAPLLEIGDPAGLEVQVDLLTPDAVRLPAGARATIERWGGPTLDAHLRVVEPSAFTRLSALGVEEQRVSALLDLDTPREVWAALGDGYRVEARIVEAERENALSVPLGAAFRHDGGWAVYALRDGRAAVTPVELGVRTDAFAEVTSGLEDGATVVVHPSEKVRDGARVEPRE